MRATSVAADNDIVLWIGLLPCLLRRAGDHKTELFALGRKMRAVGKVEEAQFDRPVIPAGHAPHEIALEGCPATVAGIDPETHVFDEAFRLIRHFGTPYRSRVVNEWKSPRFLCFPLGHLHPQRLKPRNATLDGT